MLDREMPLQEIVVVMSLSLSLDVSLGPRHCIDIFDAPRRKHIDESVIVYDG